MDWGLLLRIAVAVAAALVLWKVGRGMLGSLVQPRPDPPPPGELRKVKIIYRCSTCGTEVRMTMANDQVPEPPRHCMDEMEFIRTGEDET